ncbi:MAG: C40 family peptidase [Actinomycetota bacterium]|nr:C40 family peptidase [Actinomycetota bacterium]
MAAWAQAGVSLPHYTVSLASAGTATIAAAMVPGDLILVSGDDGTLAAPGHVGMYIGDGLVINAASPQTGIRVQTYDDFVRSATACRPSATSPRCERDLLNASQAAWPAATARSDSG